MPAYHFHYLKKREMGCVGSKHVGEKAAAVAYRPAPASVACFDINTIGEPWLVTTTTAATEDKAGHLPLQILEKLEAYDVPPQSWVEISKTLEDLKPTILTTPPRNPAAAPPNPKVVQKNQSFHTLEELGDGHVNSVDGKVSNGFNKPPSSPPPARSKSAVAAVLPVGFKPVSRNSFVLRDKQEREKNSISEAEQTRRRLRRDDPLSGLPELCPPGGEESVVLYTTTLRGVRRTFEDCETARQTLEGQCSPLGVEVDERDVSLHGEYLRELRGLLGEEDAAVPRLFVKGRYVGGVDEVVRQNEVGRLAAMVRDMVVIRKSEEIRRKKGGRADCGGCGGARFMPCLQCSGSCKVLVEDGKEMVRCHDCNENGLVQCPICRH